MRRLVVILLLGILLGQHPLGESPLCLHAQLLQQEGNPEHRQPPTGWLCTPKGMVKQGKRTTEKPCACHPIATQESSCEDRIEDRSCLHYCFKTSCGCEAKACR